MSTTPEAALKAAIAAVGGVSSLARELDITPSAVVQWRRVPAERVIAVERLSGVSRSALRPDLYPAEAETAA